MTQPTRKIFISYRHADDRDFVVSMYERFAARFGKENIFIDSESIPALVSFEQLIQDFILGCDACIVIIGKHWLQLLREKQKNQEKDYVRIEVETALAREGLIVAPVCILGAEMPKRNELPVKLRPICDIHAAQIRGSDTFDADIDALFHRLDQAWQSSGSQALPNLPTALAYMRRGSERAKQGDSTGAIEDFSAALRIDSQYYDAYIERGIAKIDKRDNPSAIEDFNSAALLRPNYSAPFVWRALAKINEGFYEQAVADCTHALSLWSKESTAYLYRGIAHLRLRDYDRAIEDFIEAIHLQPKSAYAYFNRGLAWVEMKDDDEAIADFTEAIRLSPGNLTAYENRGAARLRKGYYDGAIADYTEAIRLNPRVALHYYSRGICLDRLGKYSQAVSDFQQYLMLGGIERPMVERWIREITKRIIKGN